MNTEAKVGVFVMASVVLMAVTIYFVRAAQTVRGQVEFRTYFQDAGGLEPDAGVLFGGIRVGRITTVHPWSKDATRIEVVFELKPETPVNQKSIARVGTVTLMGSPALLITAGSNDAPRLKAGDVVASEEALSMTDIARRVGTVADTANDLLVDLRREVPAVTGQLRPLLANLNAMTGSQNQQQIRALLAQTSALLRDADTVVVSARPLVSNVDRTVSNVNATIDAVRGPLIDDLTALRKTIDDARDLIVGAQGVVRTNQEDFGETMRALRSTSDNLRVLTEQLEQRPFSLVRTTQPEDRKVPR
jgi:phospholipid/cholesterol/gamma-HCH transport system substrate-binding protein